jgi:peptide/nickel transport system substrate-binding protein
LLAERWSMEPDGKSYTFSLRKGVKFHDGEAFDAADVKFTVYPGVGHNSWEKAYAEPELEAWILARRR